MTVQFTLKNSPSLDLRVTSGWLSVYLAVSFYYFPKWSIKVQENVRMGYFKNEAIQWKKCRYKDKAACSSSYNSSAGVLTIPPNWHHLFFHCFCCCSCWMQSERKRESEENLILEVIALPLLPLLVNSENNSALDEQTVYGTNSELRHFSSTTHFLQAVHSCVYWK